MALEVAAGSIITKLIRGQLCCMRGTDKTGIGETRRHADTHGRRRDRFEIMDKTEGATDIVFVHGRSAPKLQQRATPI